MRPYRSENSRHAKESWERDGLEESVTITPPSWLSEERREEWLWAANYLLERTTYQDRELGLLIHDDFKALTRLIHNLESTTHGLKLLARLRNAIRQRQYRSSKGSRTTCSFTLPVAIKAALGRLAKGNRITVTAQIQRLIEDATELASERKATKRQEALNAKIMRNDYKLALELNKVRIDETEKQLRHCQKQLARWETFWKDEPLELSTDDEAAATKLTEERMRAIKEAISAAEAKYRMLSPRAI